MLKFVTGDIFDYEADIRVNTVNCEGVMGKGIALQFKKRYPRMFDEYKKECKMGNVKPGKPHVWARVTFDNSLIIINLPTKTEWRKNSEYDYIEKGLLWLKTYLEKRKDCVVTLPAPGCGHGGLDWEKVKDLIHTYLDDLTSTILVFNPESSTMYDSVMRTYKEKGLEFLSNMYPCKIIYAKQEFPSAEHLYQWMKVEPGQEWWKDKIRTAEHPGIAKKLANNPKCPLIEVDNVEAYLLHCMTKVIELKFTQNEDLLQKLLKVPKEDLTEYNYWNDTFWGISIQKNEGEDQLGRLYREFVWKYKKDVII